MKKLLKQMALECGFAAVGVTTAEPVDELLHLKLAIDGGLIADMAYLAREPKKRCDPRSLFPEAKSVIVLAMRYPSPEISKGINVASFARGRDYHEVAREKMRELWGGIGKIFPGARCKLCVDTSPILEKALAERAGVGWIGKHSILVSKELGSFFAICEILTDLEIEPDAPEKNKCGNCTKCIDACPTCAICAPFRVDSRRCRSYLTASAKTLPPLELAALIPDGAFGCDLCQLACPYNKIPGS